MAAPLCLGRGQACAEIQLVAGEPFGDQHEPAQLGHRRLGASAGSTQAAVPSRARQRSSAARRLRLANSPKWRMRTKPPGRT